MDNQIPIDKGTIEALDNALTQWEEFTKLHEAELFRQTDWLKLKADKRKALIKKRINRIRFLEDELKDLRLKLDQRLGRKYVDELLDDKVGEWLIKLNSKISHYEHLHALSHGNPDPKLSIGQREIDLAREVALTSLLEVNRTGFVSCPIHEEKTPSFKVYADNHWYCFGCNQGGDTINLVMSMNKMNFIEAVKFLLAK